MQQTPFFMSFVNWFETSGRIKLFILISSLGIAACQTRPPAKIVTQSPANALAGVVPAKPVTVQQQSNLHGTQQNNYTPLKLKAGDGGLTDTNWDIVSLNSKNPQVFINRPYLYLQSASQDISGSTGCNALRGSYRMEAANNISLQAFAGHMNCDDALAQEADIMDVLSRAVTYQLQQNMLFLYDNQGQLLLTARRR